LREQSDVGIRGRIRESRHCLEQENYRHQSGLLKRFFHFFARCLELEWKWPQNRPQSGALEALRKTTLTLVTRNRQASFLARSATHVSDGAVLRPDRLAFFKFGSGRAGAGSGSDQETLFVQGR
jgi:hypothetical protein